MSTAHDIGSYLCQRIILDHMRDPKPSNMWNPGLFSNELVLSSTNKNWPSEDGRFVDQKKKLSIALEYKPLTETKRGIQTGLGQAITYIEKGHSASYLICPKKVENFEISQYMKSVFENTIYGKLPIGLIQHNVVNDVVEVEMLVGIAPSMIMSQIFDVDKTSRYWAFYRDSNPHIIYLLLKTAQSLPYAGQSHDWAIWTKFFDTYYFPVNARNLKPYTSSISHFNERYMRPFEDKKIELKRLVDQNQIDEDVAIEEINRHCRYDGLPIITKSTQKDNLFKSYKKNTMSSVSHLNFWDENYTITELGEQFIKIGDKYGGESEELIKFYGSCYLTIGKHYDLILDFQEALKNNNFSKTTTIIEIKSRLLNYMEKKGWYKRNIGRAVTTDSTKLFSNEFQLWNKLGILNSNRFDFDKNSFDFNWQKIEEYYNNPNLTI